VSGALALGLALAYQAYQGPLGHCAESFGLCTLRAAELEKLPHGGTVWSVIETLDPVAVTDRIDVAGIESGSFGLWSTRGSSWSQNGVRLDGEDVTDPGGGRPLFYPVLDSMEELSLVTAAQGAGAASPGAELTLTTRGAPGAFFGSGLFRYTSGALQASNLGTRLIDLGIEPREFVSFPQGLLEAGGRGVYGNVYAFRLTSRVPHFPLETEANLLSGTGKFHRGRLSLLGIAQQLDQPQFGAAPGVSPEATLAARQSFQVAQAHYRTPAFETAFSFARASLAAPYLGSASPGMDLARRDVMDAPASFGERRRTRLGVRAGAERRLSRHRLFLEGEWSRGGLDDQESVPGNRARLFVDGEPHAVALYEGTGRTDLAIQRWAVSLEDRLALGERLHLSAGLRLDASRSDAIQWLNLSPRLSLELWLDDQGRTRVHASLGRYPHALTSGWAAAAGAGRSPVLYRWLDRDGDRQVSAAEVGQPLRREGPVFTSIDPDLPRPVTDELSLGISRSLRSGHFRFSGYHRRERNLLETVNLGVSQASYSPFVFPDVGIDGVFGTPDDVALTLFDQRAQFGEDRYLLTHPAGLDSFSQGVELALALRSGRLGFWLSGRAYRDVGSAGPGNAVGENDTGRPGSLFDDPNAAVNARGRLFFDRAFTGKSVLTLQGPWSLGIAAVTRYWDGQPFARFIYLPDLGQGFTRVNAFDRGRLRYTYNLTLDLRVQREFPLGRRSLTLALDVFNTLNQALETEENARSGEEFRQTTAVQPARTLRGELRWRF